MPHRASSIKLEDYTYFGEFLHFLRRRARLTQRELGMAVGYSEAQISRLEQNKRLPDPTTLAALFVPALGLEDEPDCVAHLMELASSARTKITQVESSSDNDQVQLILQEVGQPQEIPPQSPYQVERSFLASRLRTRLSTERCVALCGLAGMGKTTLAADMAREHANIAPVFWLTLTEGITNSLETIIRQMSLFLFIHKQEQVRPLLNSGQTSAALPLARQVTLLGSAMARLASDCARAPLLCLDNFDLVLHDDAIVRVVQHLLAATPAWLLLTSRESVPLPGIAQINVNGLDLTEGKVLLQNLLGDLLDEPLAQRLLSKTNNPMLLRLAIGELLDKRAEPFKFIGQMETQPQVASYLLKTTLKKLSPAAWKLLSLISVFHHPIDLMDETLIGLSQSNGDSWDFAAAAIELQERHLIDDPRRADLHPLVHDYVYSILSTDPQQRMYWHRTAGEWLECCGPGDVLETAYQFSYAGQFERAVDIIAGQEETLIQRGQAIAAADLLNEILRLMQTHLWQANPPSLLQRIYTERGYLLTGTLRSNEAEESFRQALNLASYPAVRAYLVYRLSQLILQRNGYAEALQLIQEATAALSPSDTLLKARLAVVEASAQYNLTQLTEARQTAENALQLASQLAGVPQPLVEEIRARSYNVLANVSRIQRNRSEAFEYIHNALVAAKRGNLHRLVASLQGFMGGLLYDQGDLEASLKYRQEALTSSLAIGDSYQAAYFMIHLSANYYISLEAGEALQVLDQARDILQQIGDTQGVGDQESMRASCLLLQGRVSEARQAVDRLFPLPENHGRPRMQGYYLNKLAIIQLVEGPPQNALATLRQALALPVVKQDIMLHFELMTTFIAAYLSAGDKHQAQLCLDESPVFDGLSLWSKLDRLVVEAYAAILQGKTELANQIINNLAAQSGKYPLYHVRATRLSGFLADTQKDLPGLMWMGDQ